MRENIGNDIVIHVVGTKSDVAAQEPSLRKIPFEKCIAYIAENLHPQKVSTPSLAEALAAAVSGDRKWVRDFRAISPRFVPRHAS